MKRLFAICAVLAFVVGTTSADITGSLTPDSISGAHQPGETICYDLDYSIDITGGATGKADVLFLTDTTGSMGGYIYGIKTAFSGIVSAIETAYGGSLDINYGVADYRNYTDGGSYTAHGITLRQSFTDNTAAVQSAINGYYASGGADGPESQLKAMETLSANWLTAAGTDTGTYNLAFDGRSDAQKILVWAGDYYGHIEGDTSASGSPPFDYYPTVQDTVDALNSQGIVTFGLNTYTATATYGLNSTYGVPVPGVGQQDYITSNTGGQSFYNVGSGGPSIESAIVDSITGGVETLTNITLKLEGTDAPFTVSPLIQTTTGSWGSGDSPVTGTFTICADASMTVGDVATFDMVLLGNGAELDRTAVDLTVVPVPGAVLLGLLGFSAAGLKLRRFA